MSTKFHVIWSIGYWNIAILVKAKKQRFQAAKSACLSAWTQQLPKTHLIRDVRHLKKRLIEEWQQFDQTIVDHAVKKWRLHLKLCEGWQWTLNISFNAKTALFRATPNLEQKKVDVAYEVWLVKIISPLICVVYCRVHCTQSRSYWFQLLWQNTLRLAFCSLEALIFLAFTKIAIFQ